MHLPSTPHTLASAVCGAKFAQPGWRLLLALLLCAVTWLALVPTPPKMLSTGWDKLNHALAFSTLAVVATLGFAAAWWRIGLGLLAYGGLIEIVQALMPPREADLADLMTDGLGIVLGLLLARALRWAARRYAGLTTRPG